MPTQPVSFGLESRPGKFGPEGGARLYNVYAEQSSNDARFPFVLYPRPGLRPFATLNGGKFRGAIKFGAVGYVVNGSVVDKVDSTGAVAQVGAFAGAAPVQMARNRKSPDAQVAIVSEGLRAILSGDTIEPISDTDLPPPIGVVSIGGYFVFAIADGRYFWTSIDEGTEIDALDFASAEANPDGLVGIAERTQEIVLFGEDSIEFHVLTGSASVFERVPQTTLRMGCLSAPAIQSLNGVPIFPASDGTIRMLNGYDPERISHHDVERDIEALEDKSAMTAQTFQVEGHQFYCLNSPTWTWVCDLLTRKWFQWQSYGLSRWKAEGVVDIGGKRIAGDYSAGVLYEIDPTANDDAGDAVIMKAISGPVHAYPNRLIGDELYVKLLRGQGLNSDSPDLADPRVMLRVSDDDGATWSDEMTAPVGKIGETTREVSFHNLGASGEDGFRFEVSMSAAVNRCIQGAALRHTLLAP